ncbi:unnamed protein product [Lactuca saligna]|uniref:Uncharacterized protein n=1 Tax=Lactuca saligna TaxID=75948 RepID=A0AA36EM88_LACSI|nr:unnamed protein product [Lactuca saligna]
MQIIKPHGSIFTISNMRIKRVLKEEILRPALERDLARNKKLEGFKLIELRNRDRHNTIKINLRDQLEETGYLLRKYVRLKENPGVFEIAFFLNKKDYNFDNEMDWVVGVNPQDIRRNIEIRDLIQDAKQSERRANLWDQTGSIILGNQKMDEAENLRKEIKKSTTSDLSFRIEEIDPRQHTTYQICRDPMNGSNRY